MAPIQGIEQSTDLRIASPVAVQRPTLRAPLGPRLMGPVPLPEAMGQGMQSRRADGREDHPHRPLDPLGLATGFPDGPLFPLLLRDPHPLDGRRPLPLVAPPLLQVPQGGVQVRRIRRRRDVVQAWGAALRGLALGFPQARLVKQVQHVGEHHRRIALGLGRHVLELHGDGW